MTSDRRSGSGDPARSLKLLWRVPEDAPRRGPQQRLNIDTVVAVAIGLADADGLDAVTMRRVAQRLGVVPMTLYTYVPGKAELLDLMLDTAYLRMPRTDTAGQPWRARLTAVAEENRAMFEEHPWAATISTGRPPLGPGLMAKYEHELSALDGLGLDDVEMDAALTFLLTFVQANARSAAEARAARQESAMDDAQWWAANAPLLEKVFDPTAYPTAARVGAAAGSAQGAAYSPEHAWEFGLGRVLDGLAVLIDRPAEPAGPETR
ncbi:TetR/AcrR family transcriptional regulator [Streptomyces mobaraensis]|uniref:TetR/AcrR family transcriptional regulator n=1 Tax=Streptomyces mobaraensis TaxID=35621 RepID=UPI00332E5787